MLQVFLFEYFFLARRPDVDVLSAFVCGFHVFDVAVVVLVDDLSFFSIEEDWRDYGVASHFLVFHRLLLEVVHDFLHVCFGFDAGSDSVKSASERNHSKQ